eukprot:m.110798 g.110798  ORF g.110798 m.110798 type:complete len:207 (-) comp12758_c2_seq1:717-1337(-)
MLCLCFLICFYLFIYRFQVQVQFLAMEDGSCPYEVLGVPTTADDKQIKKAYKKIALKNHPDKNSSPEAEGIFRRAVEAQTVLLDPKARGAYDAVLKAKKAAKMRVDKMDAQYRQAREDLEAREEAYNKKRKDEMEAKRNYEAQIRRLRQDAERRLQEEQDKFSQMFAEKSFADKREEDYENKYTEEFERDVLQRMRQRAKEVNQSV